MKTRVCVRTKCSSTTVERTISVPWLTLAVVRLAVFPFEVDVVITDTSIIIRLDRGPKIIIRILSPRSIFIHHTFDSSYLSICSPWVVHRIIKITQMGTPINGPYF